MMLSAIIWCLGKVIDVSFRDDETGYQFILISPLFELSFHMIGTRVNMIFYIDKL